MVLKECFENKYIESIVGDNLERKKLLERVIHAFYLLEKLVSNKIDFIFKGGTSLMLLIPEFNRFSVDIDILMEKGKEDNIEDLILSLTDDVFINIEIDKRRPREIIKKHFKFYYKSIYSETIKQYILLDIVFDDFEYQNLQLKEIKNRFIKNDSLGLVKIPSIDEMIGDKLTAFAPRTIGILLYQPNPHQNKYLEIVKQLYDVGKLIDHMTNINVVKDTYFSIAKIQRKNRNLDLSDEECLQDTIDACKLIISQGNFGGTKNEYEYLMQGYNGFKNYTIDKFEYSEFLSSAIKIYILCIKILYGKLSEQIEKPRNTFVGRRHKLINQEVGTSLYVELLKACFVENKNTEVKTYA